MALNGVPFLVVVAAATVLAIVASAALLPRTRRSVAGFVIRVLTQVGVSLLVVLLAGVVLNNEFSFYTDWGDLFGTGAGSQEAGQGGASADKALGAKPTGPGIAATAPATLPPLRAPGQRVQTFTVTGAKSGLKGRVLVSLPVGYEDPANAQRAYPVIEAFHGWPGNPEVWMQGVNLVPSLDTLASQRTISDVIVVAPQLEFPPGVDTECVNGPAGQPQVETWVASDVPDYLAATLRVRTDRGSWATLGFSSGGWCAAMTAMLHPDVIGAGIVLGGYFAPEFGKTYRPFLPGDPTTKRYDLTALARTSPPPVALWVETSKADGQSYPSSAAVLRDARPPLSVQSRVETSAGHRITVWADAVPEALTWLGATIPGFKPS